MFDSPCLAENEATFEISEGGIIDPRDWTDDICRFLFYLKKLQS